MNFKIPKGLCCGSCEFRLNNGRFNDFCGLFMKEIPTFSKLYDCILEFEKDGGEFEIIKINKSGTKK
jgi:hypothetical protein